MYGYRIGDSVVFARKDRHICNCICNCSCSYTYSNALLGDVVALENVVALVALLVSTRNPTRGTIVVVIMCAFETPTNSNCVLDVAIDVLVPLAVIHATVVLDTLLLSL